MIQYRTQLPDLMKQKGLPMIAIELGSAEGYSAKDFLEGGIEILYMVDLWATIPGQKGDGGFNKEWHTNNLNAAKERLKPYENKVKLLRGLTKDMAWMIPDNGVGMVYVDAAHDYENVKQDIENYYTKLVSGGIMAFHDYESEEYGVKQAVKEFAELNNLQIHLLPENKKEDAGCYLFKP